MRALEKRADRERGTFVAINVVNRPLEFPLGPALRWTPEFHESAGPVGTE